MLVLTRKVGEQIIIGDSIKVTVVSVGPGRVKIGIEAPHDVSVDRAEVHARKHGEPVAEMVGPPVPAGDVPAIVHNRIAEMLPPAVAIAPAAPRLPRKPR